MYGGNEALHPISPEVMIVKFKDFQSGLYHE